MDHALVERACVAIFVETVLVERCVSQLNVLAEISPTILGHLFSSRDL